MKVSNIYYMKYIKIYEDFNSDLGFDMDKPSDYDSKQYKWSGSKTLMDQENADEILNWLEENISNTDVERHDDINNGYIIIRPKGASGRTESDFICFWRPRTNIYGKKTVMFSKFVFKIFRNLFENNTNINKIKSILIWYINYKFLTDLEKIKVWN